MVTKLFQANLDVVFFFYGLAFILLGLTIFLQLRVTKRSTYKLRGILWLLAWFGIIHGASELLDMFELIKGGLLFFQILIPIFLCVSYFFVFLFGYQLVNLAKKNQLGRWLPAACLASFISLPLLTGPGSSHSWQISARYFLGFPGTLLCAAGLFLYYRSEADKLARLSVKTYFIAAGSAFVVYGTLGGLVVQSANFFPASIINTTSFLAVVGLPVQFFRAGAAIALAWAVGNLLVIFNYEELTERSRQLQLMENINQGVTDQIMVISKDYRIIWANNTMLEKNGLKLEEVVGKTCYEISHHRQTPCQPPNDICPFERVLATGKTETVQHIHLTNQNEKYFCDVSAYPIRDQNGEIYQFVHITRDVTNLRKLQADQQATITELTKTKTRMLSLLEDTTLARDEAKQKALELSKAYDALKQLDRLKTEFVATVSHELRTPLATIKEGVNLIFDKILGPVNNDQEKLLLTIKENISRLGRMIMELLDISRIESGKLELKHEPLDLVAVASQVIADFTPKAKEQNLELRTHFSSPAINIIGDKDKIIQIFVNTIGNSLKFTSAGFIEVSVKELEHEVECAVSDSGIGISKENQAKLFSKFQQFGRTPGSGEKGTGLGLSIVKGLVEAHKGTVRAESELGKGTKIIFTLPKNLS